MSAFGSSTPFALANPSGPTTSGSAFPAPGFPAAPKTSTGSGVFGSFSSALTSSTGSTPFASVSSFDRKEPSQNTLSTGTSTFGAAKDNASIPSSFPSISQPTATTLFQSQKPPAAGGTSSVLPRDGAEKEPSHGDASEGDEVDEEEDEDEGDYAEEEEYDEEEDEGEGEEEEEEEGDGSVVAAEEEEEEGKGKETGGGDGNTTGPEAVAPAGTSPDATSLWLTSASTAKPASLSTSGGVLPPPPSHPPAAAATGTGSRFSSIAPQDKTPAPDAANIFGRLSTASSGPFAGGAAPAPFSGSTSFSASSPAAPFGSVAASPFTQLKTGFGDSSPSQQEGGGRSAKRPRDPLASSPMGGDRNVLGDRQQETIAMTPRPRSTPFSDRAQITPPPPMAIPSQRVTSSLELPAAIEEPSAVERRGVRTDPPLTDEQWEDFQFLPNQFIDQAAVYSKGHTGGTSADPIWACFSRPLPSTAYDDELEKMFPSK